MLAKNSGIYGKELNNPEVSIDELFVSFITQIMDSVDMRYQYNCNEFKLNCVNRLEEVTDPKKNEYPGDFIQEVKIVWAACAGEGKVGININQ